MNSVMNNGNGRFGGIPQRTLMDGTHEIAATPSITYLHFCGYVILGDTEPKKHGTTRRYAVAGSSDLIGRRN